MLRLLCWWVLRLLVLSLLLIVSGVLVGYSMERGDQLAYIGGRYTSAGDAYLTDVYLLDVTRVLSVNLTRHDTPSMKYGAAWSSDGTRLAYVIVRRDNQPKIRILHTANRTEFELSHPEVDSYGFPAWRGDEIVFTGYSGAFSTWMADLSEQPITYTSITSSTSNSPMPRPSPDGTQIAYIWGEPPTYEDNLYVWSAEGTRRLTDTFQIISTPPAWSPDGGQIVVSGEELEHGLGVYAVDVNTSVVTWLSQYLAPYPPSWSPDGTRLAMSYNRVGGDEVYVMDLWAGRTDQLTANFAVPDIHPVWSPDGMRLAFLSDDQIAVIDANGDYLKLLTRTAWFKSDPAWRP